jgi:ABC-2 type transport system ATP-binding protein/lipopolysaccharide transport system ATP-binding protein
MSVEITLDDVCLSYPVYGGVSRSLRSEVFANLVGGRIGMKDGKPAMVEALRNVSMELETGDRLGLIGHNGAGKTTLLRVLAGIYAPTSGTLKVRGKVTPLIDSGFGIDREGTGIENIMLRGLYLGRSKAEVEAVLDDISAFTELGPYLNMPLRTYSSGMVARLLFAVSTAFQPEVLVMDEGIGAGDAQFMQRVRERTSQFLGSAAIVVMASHSEFLLREHCNIGAIMKAGEIVSFGEIDEQLAIYRQGTY